MLLEFQGGNHTFAALKARKTDLFWKGKSLPERGLTSGFNDQKSKDARSIKRSTQPN